MSDNDQNIEAEDITQEEAAWANLLRRALGTAERLGPSAGRPEVVRRALEEAGVPELVSEVCRLAHTEAVLQSRLEVAAKQLDDLQSSTEDRMGEKESPEISINPGRIMVMPNKDPEAQALQALTDLTNGMQRPDIRLAAAQAILNFARS